MDLYSNDNYVNYKGKKESFWINLFNDILDSLKSL